MIVHMAEVSAAFDDLISGSKSREQIADWATRLRQAEDLRQLVYEPISEEARIWKAILYLTGVDLKSSPTEYLHCTDDFLAYREEAGL